jgi:hypothetical protein
MDKDATNNLIQNAEPTTQEALFLLFALVSRLEEAIKTMQAELRNHDITIYLPSIYNKNDSATYPQTIGSAQEV